MGEKDQCCPEGFQQVKQRGSESDCLYPLAKTGQEREAEICQHQGML